ncbi:hypothetical protein Cgig2_021089 [Carnegiea gigantea]|uniref:Transcription factor CBF/NF-Y/archaeal histone domain-containing protein n=1 Tax=Carnegiea gigantea TaxID=171969 RepID=A0A9Q1JR96_9CARY|nr:hypothetical protein Cgig2_021089 [Carnegiea gigantea]
MISIKIAEGNLASDNLDQDAAATNGDKVSDLPPTQPSATLNLEQNHHIPVSNVIKIMRQGLPSDARITDDAKEAVQQCVSRFISLVTHEANERCRREHRRTVMADDLIWAMKELGLTNYPDLLSMYLRKYREMEAINSGRPCKETGSTQKRPREQSRAQGVGPSCEPMALTMAGASAGAGASTSEGDGSAFGLIPAPTMMPPVPVIPHHGLFGPLGNQDYSNGGPGAGFDAIAGADRTNPGMSCDIGDGSNDGPDRDSFDDLLDPFASIDSMELVDSLTHPSKVAETNRVGAAMLKSWRMVVGWLVADYGESSAILFRNLPAPYPPKADLIETQAIAKPHGKNSMVNEEDGESDDEDNDEFEGESTDSDSLESSDSYGVGVIAASKDIFPTARRTICLVHFSHDNLDTASTPLSRTISTSAKKTIAKKMPHNEKS